MNGKVIDLELYRFIMGQPEGLPHKEYRKTVAHYVTHMSDEEREDLRERRYEILEAWAEWVGDNYEILLRLGFNVVEAEILKDKRLTSPGMRNVIKIRVAELTKKRGKR